MVVRVILRRQATIRGDDLLPGGFALELQDPERFPRVDRPALEQRSGAASPVRFPWTAVFRIVDVIETVFLAEPAIASVET